MKKLETILKICWGNTYKYFMKVKGTKYCFKYAYVHEKKFHLAGFSFQEKAILTKIPQRLSF